MEERIGHPTPKRNAGRQQISFLRAPKMIMELQAMGFTVERKIRGHHHRNIRRILNMPLSPFPQLQVKFAGKD